MWSGLEKTSPALCKRCLWVQVLRPRGKAIFTAQCLEIKVSWELRRRQVACPSLHDVQLSHLVAQPGADFTPASQTWSFQWKLDLLKKGMTLSGKLGFLITESL